MYSTPTAARSFCDMLCCCLVCWISLPISRPTWISAHRVMRGHGLHRLAVEQCLTHGPASLSLWPAPAGPLMVCAVCSTVYLPTHIHHHNIHTIITLTFLLVLEYLSSIFPATAPLHSHPLPVCVLEVMHGLVTAQLILDVETGMCPCKIHTRLRGLCRCKLNYALVAAFSVSAVTSKPRGLSM